MGARELAGEGNIPHDDVEAYANYRRIDQTSARRSLTLELALNNFRNDIPPVPGYAGSWINQDRLGDIIFAYAGDEMQSARDLRDDFTHSEFVSINKVDYALTELDSIVDQMIEIQQDLNLRLNIIAFGVSEPLNRIHVDVESDPERAQLELERRYGGDYFITELASPLQFFDIPPVATGCRDNSRAHCNPLRGGTNIHNYNEPNNVGCTIGFTARDRVYTHVNFVTTASHCGEDRVRHSGSTIGPASLDAFSGNADARRIEVRNAGWQVRPWVYRLASSQAYALTSRYTGNNMAVGTGVSTSGRSTGWRQGEVIHGSRNPIIRGVQFTNKLHITNCNVVGDSGGSIIISAQAVGTITGGDFCSTYATYVRNLEDRLSLRVLTN